MHARRSAVFALWAIGLLSGCAERALDLGGAAGAIVHGDGGGVDGPTGPHPPGGLPQAYCERIVVLAEGGQLALFDPVALTFEDLIKLACPAQPGIGAYSIALDHDGALWVSYSNGDLFQADVQSGACSRSTLVVPHRDARPLDITFLGAPPTEELFTAGPDTETTYALGRVQLDTGQFGMLTTLKDGVELTTTDAGELYGLFRAAVPHVVRFDPVTGAIQKDLPVGGTLGNLRGDGIAFSAFRGALYAFVWPQGSSTSVYHLDPATGAVERILRRSGRNLISATTARCFN